MAEAFQPKDAVKEGLDCGLLGAVVGFGVSAIQNTLTKRNVGAVGVFTRSGGSIVGYAMLMGTYAFTKAASANLREQDDAANAALGGFLGGTMLALTARRSLPVMLGFGAMSAVAVSVVDFTGGVTSGSKEGVATFDQKEELRLHRRAPIQEALDQLGEGKGIQGPGYRERRAQRIKDAYGIEVPST